MKKHLIRSVVTCAFAVSALLAACGVPAGRAYAAEQPAPAKGPTPAEQFDALRKLGDSGKHQEAAAKLREFTLANAAWDRIDDANLLLGAELVLSGEITAGKDVLDRLIQKAPDSELAVGANFYVGKAAEALGDFPGAVLAYDFVLRRSPKNPLAPEAALREALVSEKVLQNLRRAREVYELIATSYADHPRIGAVRNHLGVLAEQGIGEKRQPGREEFIQAWQLAGAFSNADGKAFDTAFPPEAGVKLDASYAGVGPEKVTWKPVPDGAKLGDGGINLAASGVQPVENTCAYAYTVFKAPDDRAATLYVGSDDTAKVWLNGQLVLSRNVTRGAAPDQDSAPIQLKKGDNTLLLKVCNGTGGWGFYCRIDYDYAWGPAAAVQFYRQYAAKHPDDVGDQAMNGNVAGAAPALWHAGELTEKVLNDAATAVDIYKQYENLPRAQKGEGFVAAARVLTRQPAAGNAAPMFEAALRANAREDWRLEYARWLRSQQKEDEAAKHFVAIIETSKNWNFVADSLNNLGPERVRKYLDGHPTDLAVFRHYLTWLKDGDKQIEGRQALDLWLARADVDWKTTIAGEWFQWTGKPEDARRLVRAADAEGMMQPSAAASLKLADAFMPLEAAVAKAPWVKVMDGGTLVGELRCAVEGDIMSVQTRVYDRKCTPAAKAWKDTRVELYCSMPGTQVVRQVVFTPLAPDGAGTITFHENGNPIALPAIQWFFAPLKDSGYEVFARMPLSGFGVNAQAPEFLFEAAVVAEGKFLTLFESGTTGAFSNNGKFGKLSPAKGLQGIVAERLRPDAPVSSPAQDALASSLETWGAYADFPKGEFAKRLAAIARLRPLMMPNPKKVDGKPEAEPDQIASPVGKASRQAAADMMRKHGLGADPVGADMLAQMGQELDAKAAADDMVAAVRLLVGAGMLNEAAAQMAALLKALPEHDARRVDALYAAAVRGPQGWEKPWNEVIIPAAQAELKHFEGVKNEEGRLARVKLMRFFDAKQSVASHEEFLREHAGGAQAAFVRQSLLGAEMRRAGVDPGPAVLAAIKDIERDPRVALGIPPEAVPAGPQGYELYLKNVKAAVAKVDANLAPQLFLHMAQVCDRFGEVAEGFDAVKQVVTKYGNTPQAVEAKRLAGQMFARGFFAPKVTQQDAEQAFAWKVEAALGEPALKFAGLADNSWRVACHPASRLHAPEDLDSLYLYSTHQYVQAPATMLDFLSGVYGSYPSDGLGPVDKVENGLSPLKGGDRFMLYRWGLIRAPMDGVYHFWFSGDDYVGIELDGVPCNIPDAKQNYYGVRLGRGLHVFRVVFGDWGGGSSMVLDWQTPVLNRQRLGPEAFSADMYPLIMDEAVANQGAAGFAQWEAYVAKFPRDARGRMMRLETLCLQDPNRAAGELNNLINACPGNLHYRERLADCLWRLGRRDEALKLYASLASARADGLWQLGHNGLWKDIFLGGREPLNFVEDYEDRVRERGDWNAWLARAVATSGDDGAVAARVAAADQVRLWDKFSELKQQALGRVNAGMAKEAANIEAAKALAAKQDAEELVRAQAREAIARAERRIQQLTREVQIAQQKSQRAQATAAGFRQALGLGPDQAPEALFVNFARGTLDRRTISPGVVFGLVVALWSGEDKESIRPFLEYVVKYSPDRDQVRWCVDRLVDLAVAGKDVGPAVEVLSDIGWRAPRDGFHADYLKRSCDLAIQSGQVYLFARNAHLLARLHGSNPGLSGYLDRLGEVFEKAGNVRSAEQEYRRVVTTVKDPARTRTAQIALARLYQNQGRSTEALQVLTKLVALRMPEDEKGKPKRAGNPGPNPGPNPGANPGNPGTPGQAQPEAKPEDAEALLLAARCYLSLEMSHLALDAYDRASRQKEFGNPLKPDRDLLLDLARSCLEVRMPAPSGKAEEGEDKLKALPLAIVERADKALKIVDTMFRFYGDKMTPKEKVEAILVRADASIMMRNYPRAIEEIRAAKEAAGDSPAALLADLKMGEVHLATDNADQALPLFTKLAKMNRDDVSPLALFWLGTTQLSMNKRDEAIESFRVLWERYAESELVRRAVYNIARTYAEQGAFLDAIRLYEAVGAINSMPREKVVPGDVLTVKVWDADHYLGTGQYTIPVKVNASSGDVEELLLDMNKINHSLFLGTIRTELGEPKLGDGLLQVYGTDLVYVTYEDKFKALDRGVPITLDSVKGARSTSVIQVVEDADIKVSPTVFVEEERKEEDIYKEKTEEELQEEQRLAGLSARLERGEAVVRPGNVVYVRVKDGDLDRSKNPDKVTVTAFTFAPALPETEKVQQVNLARAMENPHEMPLSDEIPSNGEFSSKVIAAPGPKGRPRLDTVEVALTETGPHTGIFYGTVKTAVNGPTAIASDQSAQSVAALAIDGRNGATDAWMGFIDGKPDKWIEVDLKELYDVSKIVWDRGEGADDRYMIDYTVTLRGYGTPVDLKKEKNKSAHNNEIVFEKPVTCRWIKLTAHTYDSDAPAISQIQVFDKDGKVIVPPQVSPLERVKNDVLEFNVGDCMAAEVLDEENVDPGRPMTRTSNPLGVAYVDGHIDAVYMSRGENDVRGSLIWSQRVGQEEKRVWARRTKRVNTKDVLQIAIIDPDLDVDEELNTVKCDVISSSGDKGELVAKEIEKTAAIFTARIQLSADPAAKDDNMRLWVRPGDYVMLRFRDEENRDPGHAVWRESFVFAADDEAADFLGDISKVPSPYHDERSIEPPNWEFTLREPDQALPGFDKLEMQALSFATGDKARFNVLLRNLDGLFSSRLPVVIGDKPEIELPKDADPNKPRRIRSLDERYYRYGEEGWERSTVQVFDVPLAVAGDDVVWMAYQDETPRVTAARMFMGVVPGGVIEQLRQLGVKTDELPETARTEGLKIVLKDPYAALADTKKAREQAVLAEIARKKRHFGHLTASYQQALGQVGKQIDELTRKEGAPKPEPKVEVKQPPKTPGVKEAPLTKEEEVGGADIGQEFMATEDVIRAAALRRDRDGLAEAMKELDRRVKALERYKTAELEKAIDQAEEAELARQKAAAAAGPPSKAPGPVQKPPAWYTQADWWKQCGGVVPGTVLKIRVEDPDLQGDTATVTIAPMGNQAPQFYTFLAKAVEGQQGVFEVTVPTGAGDEMQGGMPLKGVSSLMLTYADTVQQKFTPARSGYLSLASNAELRVTGPDFLEAKTDFHLGEDIFVLINDPDMDKTRARDYVWVKVASDKGDVEDVAVRESQPHSGTFRGSIPTRFG